MIYLFCFVCLLVYIILPTDHLLGLGISPNHLVGCLTYSFSSASLLHCLVNIVALCMMWEPICKLYLRCFYRLSERSPLWFRLEFLLVVYAGAVLGALPNATYPATVGSSGMVYMLLGMLLPLNPTLRQLKAFIPLVVIVLLQYFVGGSNILLHLTCFGIGFMYIFLRRLVLEWSIRRRNTSR